MQQLEFRESVIPSPGIKYTEARTPANLAGWLPILWTRVLFAGTPIRPEALSWQRLASLFVLSGLLLYPCMSFFLFEPDEGRYAQIPREMVTAGEWIIPTLQATPYLDKPPLLYWLVMVSYSVFGFHDWAARLVPALAVHAAVLVTYVLGRRIVGERSAYWGTLFLIVSPLFLGVGRLLVLDGLLSLWVTLAGLAIYLAQADERLRIRWWLVAAFACGLGVLTKGPVALLLVVPPLLCHRRLVVESATISWRAWGGFLGVVLAVSLPWYIAVCVLRPEFVRYFLWQHNVQRFVEPFDHVRPVWFYGPIVLYGLLPMVLLAWPFAKFLTSMRPVDTNARCPSLGYLMLAGAWCVFFFSLAGSKLPTYILPAFPPLCLALGCFVARTDWRRARSLVALVVVAWLVQVGVNWIALPIYARQRSPMQELHVMRERCGDPATPIICFPRNVDSVAFYIGRSDFQTFRSKEISQCVQELGKHSRTVVLFGHRNSPETLARQLPPNLRMSERRKMGLCESAIIVRSDDHLANCASAPK